MSASQRLLGHIAPGFTALFVGRRRRGDVNSNASRSCRKREARSGREWPPSSNQKLKPWYPSTVHTASDDSAAGLLNRLRTETRARHERLDSLLGPIVATSRESYGAFLAASWAAVGAIERGVERQLGSKYRAQRQELLSHDLAALGTFRPRMTSSFEPENEPAAYGCAYVMEGSALGGLVLAKRVLQALGSDAPVSYLRFRDSQTGPRWHWFLAELKAFEQRSTSAQHEQACRAACATFEQYALAFAVECDPRAGAQSLGISDGAP